LLEAVVSVFDQGKWVGSVDVLKLLDPSLWTDVDVDVGFFRQV
jgi:hypothetical protein